MVICFSVNLYVIIPEKMAVCLCGDFVQNLRGSSSSSSRVMQFSGFLVPSSSDIEHVMQQREHQIQNAMRRARQEKQRYRTAMDSEHHLLLHHM